MIGEGDVSKAMLQTIGRGEQERVLAPFRDSPDALSPGKLREALNGLRSSSPMSIFERFSIDYLVLLVSILMLQSG